MRKILSLLFVALLTNLAAWSQKTGVSGRVTEQNGDPVPFASINVKGTKVTVAAGADGTFKINAKAGDVLVVSAVNFQSTEVTVGADNTANATLTRIASNLSEVVVTTALAIQRQAKELGYSTTKITNKDLTQAKVTNISTGLAGKVSGLQVNLTNNSVNPAVRIVLRGNRSITGNNQALLVLDGVPIDDPNYINKINPDDVDNVSVLKGAVAAAIYGSKASNGVLIITTKRGTRGKPTITIGNTINLETVSYLPKLQHQFGAYGGEGAYTNANGTVEPVPFENQSYGPAYDGRTMPLAIKPVFADDGITVLSYDTLFQKYSDRPDEKKDFWNTGITNQFDASYSSGDDKSTFYLGFQDVNVHGVVPGDEARRDNVRLNGSREYGRFRADYSFSYNQAKTDQAGLSYNQTSGGVFSGRPLYFEVLNAPSSVPLTQFKDWSNLDSYSSPDAYYNAYATNPYWTLDNSRRKVNTYDLLGNINLSMKVSSWLTVADRVGLTQTTSQWKYTRAGITFAPWAIADPWSAGNVPSSLGGYLAPSEFDQTFEEQRLNNDLIGAFDKTFGDFSVKGLVGFNFAQRYQRNISLQGDNLQFPGFYNISSVLGVPGYGESSYKQREWAIYEEVTVGYKNYLFLHGSNRDEWNSVLDPSQQHYNYPGGDLSFVFTNAFPSLKNNKFLSYGKVRGGVSKVANINLGTTPYGAYSLDNYFSIAGGFPFGNLGGYSQATTSLNPLIKPEKTTAEEVGLELGLLNSRVNVGGTWYHSISKDQTLIAGVSPATGYTAKVVNAGQVTNKGIELDASVTVIKSKSVTWNVGATYTHQENRVDQLLPGVPELFLGGFTFGVSGGIYAVEGQPYPVIKTEDWIRTQDLDSSYGYYGPKILPGSPNYNKVVVDPLTGRPSINSTNTLYGTTNPTDLLGINTSLTWKGITFAAVLDYRGGNYIMNSVGGVLDFTGVSYHSAENGRQRFIFPNSVVLASDGKSVANNATTAVDNGGNIGGAGFWPDVYTSGVGSVYVTSAAFWKLREVSLTYEIPQKALAKVSFIKRATIGAVGRNLLMLRPKSNFWTDPEFSDAGSGNALGSTSEYQTPPTRLYGFNLTLTF